jgi:hypothetical protein
MCQYIIITKYLEGCYDRSEYEDRSCDEKNVLEYGDKYGLGIISNKGLFTLNTPANVNTNPLLTPTKKTAATFNKNATLALESSINGPTRARS